MSSTQLYYTLKWPKTPPPIVNGVLRAHVVMMEAWLEEFLWLAEHNYPQDFYLYADTIKYATVEEQRNFLLAPPIFELMKMARTQLDSASCCEVIRRYAQDIQLQQGNALGWTALADSENRLGQGKYLSSVMADSIIVDFDSPYALRMDLTSSVLSETPLPALGAVREQILTKLSDALKLIDEVASTAGQLIRNTTRCIRVRVSNSTNTAAETDPNTIGEMRLLNYHFKDKDIIEVADTLIHESLHSFLAMYELQHGSFVAFSQSSLVRPVSPWSGNPIPYNAFTHAVYIYFALFEFYRLLYPHLSEAAEKKQVALLMNRCSRGFRVLDLQRALQMVGKSPDWAMKQYQLMSQDVQSFYPYSQEAVC